MIFFLVSKNDEKIFKLFITNKKIYKKFKYYEHDYFIVKGIKGVIN